MAKKTTNPYVNAPYEVGKGKPPKHSQIKPGEVRNPRGRPRKPTVDNRAREIMEELLSRTVPIRNGEEVKQVTAYEALLMVQLQQAIKGDRRSSDFLLREAQRTGAMRCEPAPPENTRRGVLVVPPRSATAEEWEATHGRANREAAERFAALTSAALETKAAALAPSPLAPAPAQERLVVPKLPKMPGPAEPEAPRVIPESEKQLAIIREDMAKNRARTIAARTSSGQG